MPTTETPTRPPEYGAATGSEAGQPCPACQQLGEREPGQRGLDWHCRNPRCDVRTFRHSPSQNNSITGGEAVP